MSGRRAKEQRRLAKDDIRSVSNAMQERIEKVLATKSFAYFLKFIHKDNKNFIFSPYVQYLCDVIDSFMREEIRKLAVFIPPQHIKSSTFTESLVCYYIMYHKNRRAMITSYGDDTAQKFGEANLNKLLEFGYLFGVEVSKTSRSKTKFDLEGYRGGLLSTTMRGGATGFSADLLVIDDPVKGPGDLTKLKRDEVYDMYQRVFKTRLSDKEGQEILIMTRWHTDDLAGRIIDDTWTVIELPALSLGVDVDPLGRPEGEPLFPELKSLEFLLEQKRSIGEKAWQSMYQQNPVVDNGIVFKREWVKYYASVDLNDFDEFYQTWDLILKGGEKADYAVGQFWGIKNDKFYLIDMIRGQWTYAETLVMFNEFYERWGSLCNRILIEDKMNGTNLLNDMRHLSNLEGIIPRGDKYDRIEASAIEWELGNVYLPEGEPFSIILAEEAIGLRSVKYDDAIDACAQLVNYVRAKRVEKKKALITAKPRFRKFV